MIIVYDRTDSWYFKLWFILITANEEEFEWIWDFAIGIFFANAAATVKIWFSMQGE